MSSNGLTPRQIVEKLDRHIIGQADAKRAVAIALRNRWRRQNVPEELADEKKGADDTHQHFVEDVSALVNEASHSWRVFLAWLAVWIPLGWGGWMTVQKTIVLFK